MIVSKIDRNILKKLWRYSDRVWVKEYNPQKYGGGESLAKYLMGCKGNKKFTKGNWRSWNSSKNLLKPTVIIKDSGLSRAQTAQIARDRIDDQNFWEKRYEGYRFVSATPIFNDWNGWWYIYVKLYKPPE